jgi:hypothetical protein
VIALAIAAEVLAASIQTYAIFEEIPESERILTVIVLIIAMIQIVVSRPRARSDPRAEEDAPGSPASVTSPNRPEASEANAAAEAI